MAETQAGSGAGPPLYFVCYSRAERDLVSKVEAKLAARRRRGELDVWRDVRNLDVWEQFTPEILATLQRAAGAIIVVSDAWYGSDYIHQYEWSTIRERKERDPAFGVFLLAYNRLDDDDPLRERTFVNDLTDEILLGCSDLVRDTVLTRLSDLVGEHARSWGKPAATGPRATAPSAVEEPMTAPLDADAAKAARGGLHGVPELPEQFVEPGELAALGSRVVAAEVTAISGLHGEGGTGKSVLACALARRCAHLFPGGAHWVAVGERATSEDVRRIQADLLADLRAGRGDVRVPLDTVEGREMLAVALAETPVLLVADDIWHPWQARAFDVAGPGSEARVLFTTRFADALPRGSAMVAVARLTASEATTFLRALPAGVPSSVADLDAVLDAAGGLRLALAVLSATAATEGSWEPVVNRLDGLAARFGHGDDASSAQKALYVAMDTLSPDDQARAGALSAFPVDAAVPVDLLARLWDVSRSAAENSLDRLAAKDLVVRDADRVVVHDHVHDYLILQASTPLSDVHLRLWELAARTSSAGWPALANDEPYLWDRLVWHACRAGLNSTTLRALVSDLAWLAERVRRQTAAAAEQDVGLVCASTAATPDEPLSRLRRVLRHGGLFDIVHLGAGLEVGLTVWADAIGLAHDGDRRLVSGSLPVPDSALRRTLRGHTSECWGIAYTPDGRLLATSSEDGTVRIWDVRTGECRRTLTGHTGAVWRVAVAADGGLLATAGEDGTARLWEAESGEPVRVCSGHTGQVWDVALGPDGTVLATAGSDGNAGVWDTRTGLRRSWISLGAPSFAVALAVDGRTLATAAGSAVEVGDALLAEPRPGPAREGGTVRRMAFSPDGQLLAVCGGDGSAQLRDVHRDRPARQLVGHENTVWDIQFSADARLVATAGEDGTARIWEAATGRPVQVLTGHTNPVHGVAFTPDGRVLATTSADGTARLWDVDVASTVPEVGPLGEVHDLEFTADGRLLAAACGDRAVRVWDTRSGALLYAVTARGPLWGVAVDAAGTFLAAGGEHGRSHVWHVGSDEPVWSVDGLGGRVWDVELSLDGRLLASASEDGAARVWDVATGRLLSTFAEDRGAAWEVAFARSGGLLATVFKDAVGSVRDVSTGEVLARFTGHRGEVWDVAFGADDRLLATASGDRTARIWDVETGATLQILSGHSGQVWGVAFSPDGRHLATSAGDGAARIWDVASGQCLLTLPLACSGPVAWNGNRLALAAGAHRAVVLLPDLSTT